MKVFKIKKIIKFFIPYGLILLRRKLKDKRHLKNNSYNENDVRLFQITKNINLLCDYKNIVNANHLKKNLGKLSFNLNVILDSEFKKIKEINSGLNIVFGNPNIDIKCINYLYFYNENIKNCNLLKLINSSKGILTKSISKIDYFKTKFKKPVLYLPCDNINNDSFMPAFNNNIQNAVSFYFLRILLYFNFIDFESFYKLSNKLIKLERNNICLSLPETFERRKKFIKNNNLDVVFFPGLAYPIGWVGCAYSYKYLSKMLLSRNDNVFMICEDDVFFKNEFYKNFEYIVKYISENNVDLFSCFSANIDSHTNLYKTVRVGSISDVIILSDTTSAVCNFYSKKMLSLISNWDDKNKSAESNTIDQYMRNNSNSYKFMLTFPFIVNHDESLNSSIWNNGKTSNNTVLYKGMIDNTCNYLKKEIERLKKL